MNIPSHNPRALEIQLRKILSGIEKNIVDWPKDSQVSKEALIETSNELSEKLLEIEINQNKVHNIRKKLQEYIDGFAKPLYKRARDRAYSIHGKNSDKLNDYDFKKIL